MVDKELIENRLLKLEQILRKLHTLSNVSLEEYEKSEALQDRVERNLQIAAQICIDIGSHIIADRGYRPPAGYADIFAVLYEEGILDRVLADTMKKITGFRNILVHDYLKIDNRIVYKALKNLGDFKKFAETIAILLQQPGT